MPAWHADYQRGRSHMAQRDWSGAIAAFDAVLAVAPQDRPTALMRERALSALKTPPAPDWDAVW